MHSEKNSQGQNVRKYRPDGAKRYAPISATVGGLAATRDRWVRLPARSFVLMLYSKMHRF